MELKFSKQSLTSLSITSVKYHDIFDYKLTKEELHKWQYKNLKETTSGKINKGRIQREKYSRSKLKIAKKAASLISKIPTVKFVGITGALAMNNADFDSDIDLFIITKANMLWITRLLVYIELKIMNYKIRNPSSKNEKDKLCLNIWLDESNLAWDIKDRNIYTAHEILQIVPLLNKDKTYEKFLWQNLWATKFWPNVKKVEKKSFKRTTNNFWFASKVSSVIENIAYYLQYFYMKSKITREVVTKTKAIFHPTDWGKVVLKQLNSQ